MWKFTWVLLNIKHPCSSEAQREFLHVKLRPTYRDNMRLWSLFGSTTAHTPKKKDWRGKAANCHTKVCFFFSSWQMCHTFQSIEAWVNHNYKHRTSLHVLSPPSSFNILQWWTCVRWREKKIEWFKPLISFLHLGSLTGSYKRKDRQK